METLARPVHVRNQPKKPEEEHRRYALPSLGPSRLMVIAFFHHANNIGSFDMCYVYAQCTFRVYELPFYAFSSCLHARLCTTVRTHHVRNSPPVPVYDIVYHANYAVRCYRATGIVRERRYIRQRRYARRCAHNVTLNR